MKDSNGFIIQDGDTLMCCGTTYDVVSQDDELFVHGEDYETSLSNFMYDRVTLSDLSVFVMNRVCVI